MMRAVHAAGITCPRRIRDNRVTSSHPPSADTYVLPRTRGVVHFTPSYDHVRLVRSALLQVMLAAEGDRKWCLVSRQPERVYRAVAALRCTTALLGRDTILIDGP